MAKRRAQRHFAPVTRVLEKNPQLNVSTFDFFDTAAVDALNWQGLDRKQALSGLQAQQRLLRVAGNAFASELLAERGYESAHSISAKAEDVFIEELKETLPGGEDAARSIHQKAVTVRGQVIHLWATLQGTIAAPQSSALPVVNLPSRFQSFFTQLPDYEDLFGPTHFCDCKHCDSIFGPAAYFVDLMRITDRYVTTVNEQTIPKKPVDLRLFERRQKLFTLPLTCSASNDLVPYLQIVNEVMADRLASMESKGDLFQQLAVAQFPFNLPANIALSQIRLYVQSLKTSVAEIFAQFAPQPMPEPLENAAARERLSLSLEQYQFITTPSAEIGVLKERYGLTAGQDLSLLNSAPVFLLQTGLTRDALAAALNQNLDAAERKAGLAHGFFFNTVLPDKQAVSLQIAPDGSESIVNLTPQTLDRLNRFIRLSLWSGISFADMDWFLASFGASEINPDSLRKLADGLLVSAVYKLPPDVTTALWADMKTIGAGESASPADLFDRVYNSPSLLKQGSAYHPLYSRNPLYKDPVVDWDMEENETNSTSFTPARLAAALGLSEAVLTSIGQALFDPEGKVALNVPNLSALYRTTRILNATGLDIEELLALLPLLDLTIAKLNTAANLIAFMKTLALLKLQGLSAGDLNYILTGEQSLSDAVVLDPEVLYEAAKTLWTLSQPQLVRPDSLIADVIDADEAAEAFKLLLKTDSILFSVRKAYEQVFEQRIRPDIAVVLTRVTAEQLEFLKPKFSPKQIKVIVRVLQQAYDAQFSLLERQLATLFESDLKTAGSLRYYFSQATELRPYLKLLLTPHPFNESSGEWPQLQELLLVLARASFAAGSLQLKPAELRAIADTPQVFSMAKDRLLTPPFAAVSAVFNLHTLMTLWDAREKDFLAFLSKPSDTSCSKGKKSKALAKLSGTDQAQICQLVDYLGKGPAIYDTLAGLGRLQECLALLALTGMDAFSIKGILNFRDLPASKEKWPQWEATALNMVAVAKAKNEAEWVRTNSAIVSQLNERRRNLLLWRLLWRLRLLELDHGTLLPDATFTTPRQVSDLLLIDIERSGCADISYIVEGLNAVQLYLQRCRLNLEPGVVRLPIPEVWWEWMMNYRIWEANRRIFLYPENYLIPSLRRSKTSLFRSLEESLQQSDLSPTQVAPAYKTFLDGVSSLATLTSVDMCRYVVDDVRRGPQDTLFLFARTQAEPYLYYYARKEGDAGWSEWKKIEVVINSRYVSPVYAFNRLFLFWVELKANSISRIKAEGDQRASISQNEVVYTAAVRYSFYDFNGQWVTAQTLYSDDVTYVAPSITPFNDSSGYELFDMESLYWRKVSVLRLTPDVIRGVPENTVAGEKLAVLYGPFLNNNVNGISVNLPPRPDGSRAAADPARFQFEQTIYDSAVEVEQALRTFTRGPLPLRNATTINGDLDHDFLLRNTEFPILEQNQSPGVPPAVLPRLDRPTSQLAVAPSFNVLRTNYDGDYTSRISSAALSRLVKKDSFAVSGLNAGQSSGIFGDLEARGILKEDGKVSLTFNRNTNLRYLFEDESFKDTSEADKRRFIAVIQDILFELRAAGAGATDQSFLLNPIDAAASDRVYNALRDNKIIDEVGRVWPQLTSATDLRFLFSGIPEPQKRRLIGEVRRILFGYLGDPVLLESISQETAAVTMVKNQPGWFVFNNGNEAFMVIPDAPVLPMISTHVEVASIHSSPKVHPDTFVTPDIPRNISERIIADLKSKGVINANHLVVKFDPLTDLSFVLEGEPEPQRGIRVAEAREILLGLPSITGFDYYFELGTMVLKADSFVGPGISPEESAKVLAALQDKKIVDSAGIISNAFNSDTDLNFLFPKADPETRRVLIRQVRIKLLETFAAVWQTTLYDLKFRFVRLTTAAIGHLSRALFAGGISSLLSLKSQQIPVVPLVPFSRYRPTWRSIPPANFDGAQVDFNGTFGAYFWELFFYSPQLIAASLLADRRFQDALTWLQYIFNPTLRPQPLSPSMFITPDISLTLAERAFQELKKKDYITPQDSVSSTFRANTPLDFLWDGIHLNNKEAMIRQVRNVLLNNQLSNPAARFWQFQPFRNHTLEELLKILTDPVQIAVYNNDPFDPFAIARLRIGAFEKAIFMSYVDTLIAWGDSLFTQFTWESLTAASMLYFYAQDLLGPRPTGAGPCPSHPPTTFADIKKKYGDLPDGIPQFLIYMENLLPANDIVAPSLSGSPFTDIDPYFCVPENSQLLSYWDKVEDRLYKIRHCLDLEGRPRELALFQPPINPLDLVRAAASGQSSLSVLEQQQASILPYRFTVLLSTAQSLVGTVSALGSSLFSALQSRDSEALARLRAKNEIDVLNLTTLTKTQQIEAARLTVEGLVDSAQAIKERQKFYADLAKEFMNPLEVANLAASAIALYFQVASGAMGVASSLAHALPQVGSPFAMTYGGIQLGDALDAGSQVLQVYSSVADFAANTLLTVAGYQRRAQDWQLSADQARLELVSTEKQIAAAREQLATAQRELEIHLRTIENNKKEAEFLTTRFDTQELYVWMAGRLATLYFETYRIALDSALAAQSAYRFELDRDDTFINLDYWDNLRQGLLAGESLQLSLDRMEAAFLRNSGRRLMIDKTISLVSLSPEELFLLKKTGECTISVSEALLDLDYPGQYCRQLQGAALSVLDGEGDPFPEIHGILTQIRNDVVLSADPKAVEYLLTLNGNPPDSIRTNWQASQQIAVYSGDAVSGVGNTIDSVAIPEDRYYPFEGTGAVSKWRFKLPLETNPIDFQEIADVQLTIRYFALDGGKPFREVVQSLLSGEKLAGGISIALKEFVGEDDWNAFVDSQPEQGMQTLEFVLDRDMVPPNVRTATLHRLEAQLNVASDVQMPLRSDPAFMALTIEKADVQKQLVLDHKIYTSVEFTPGIPKAKFLDAWRLDVNVGAMATRPGIKDLLRPDGRLDPDQFIDLTVYLAYRGCVFGCVEQKTEKRK